jgi:hypothetical protein
MMEPISSFRTKSSAGAAAVPCDCDGAAGVPEGDGPAKGEASRGQGVPVLQG